MTATALADSVVAPRAPAADAVAAAMAEAVRHHRTGNRALTEAAYRRVLDLDPDHVAALTNLGVLRAGAGARAEAAALYDRALQSAPDDADLLTNRANLHQASGAFELAEAGYRKALALAPDLAAANVNLGSLMARRGDLAEAERLYRAALAKRPNDATATSRLGALLMSLNRSAEARSILERAAALSPLDTHAHCLAAEACALAGDAEASFRHYRAAIELAPGNPEPWHRLALHLGRQGRKAEALETFATAVEIAPTAALQRDYAQALAEAKRDAEALPLLRSAVAANPDDPLTLLQMGIVQLRSGAHEAAVSAFRAATRIDPDLYEARFNLGIGLEATGRPAEAVPIWRDLIATRPERKEAYVSLGHLLHKRGLYDECLKLADCALAIDPNDLNALTLVANTHHERNNGEEALRWIERALAIDPDHLTALQIKALTLAELNRHSHALAIISRVMRLCRTKDAGVLLTLGCVCERAGRREEALRAFTLVHGIDPNNDFATKRIIDLRLTLCEWTGYDEWVAELSAAMRSAIAQHRPLPACLQDLSNLPLSWSLLAEAARSEALVIEERNAAARAENSFSFASRLARARTGEQRKLRLGYALPYTFQHSFPVLMQGIIAHHDRERFEVFGYSQEPSKGAAFERDYRASFDHFRDVPGASPATAARRIYEDEIDILVDVSGHTAIHCQDLMSFRPAPVQVHLLGYALTTGARYIDYLVSDTAFMPAELARECSEAMLYLPDSFMIAHRVPPAQVVVTRAMERLPEGAFVFCNFNQPFKFEPQLFGGWMRILQRVPHSVLWLGDWDKDTRRNLHTAAESLGVAADRLVFATLRPPSYHLTRLRHADLMLDSHWHGGGATTVDAMAAGVPMVTWQGGTAGANTGASLARALRVDGMVVDTLAEYEDLAVALATDPVRHRALRAQVEANRQTAPLFDIPRYVRHLEAGYQRVWEQTLAGVRENIFVPELPR